VGVVGYNLRAVQATHFLWLFRFVKLHENLDDRDPEWMRVDMDLNQPGLKRD
jgi:hypothetical protein